MDTEAHELIAGYALDALDEADRARAKELLETSEEAREELRAFTDVAAALATAAVGPAPRTELRDRIVDAAGAEGQNVVPLDVKRRARVVPVLAVGAALAACAAIAAGVWGLSVSSDLDDARLALEQKRAAAAVLSDPSARTVALEAGDGRLVVDDEGSAVLVLDALDAAPAGKTYEMWIIEGDTPVPGRPLRRNRRTRPRPGRRERRPRFSHRRDAREARRRRRADDHAGRRLAARLTSQASR